MDSGELAARDLQAGKEAFGKFLVKSRPQDFGSGGVDVVFHPNVLKGLRLGVKQAKARAIITVTRLANATHIDNPLSVFLSFHGLTGDVLHSTIPQ